MLTNLENYSWLIILPVFGLLFTKIWDALNKHSSFSGSIGFVIALCVSMLCVISVIGFFQQHEDSHEIAVAGKDGISLQDDSQHEVRFILLPYMALMMSFLLLLMLVKIAMLVDDTDNSNQPSYVKKIKTTTKQHNHLKQINHK